MTFRHVVMFTWADHVDEDLVAEMSAGLSTLPGAIDEIRSYVHGRDAGQSDGNFDYVVVADFDDVDAWRVYRDHPVHVELINTLMKPNIAQRAAVQYET